MQRDIVGSSDHADAIFRIIGVCIRPVGREIAVEIICEGGTGDRPILIETVGYVSLRRIDAVGIGISAVARGQRPRRLLVVGIVGEGQRQVVRRAG